MPTESITTDRPTARSPLVTPSWLARHLDEPAVAVIEVDVSPAAHTEGHIPGEVLWNIYTDLKDDEYRLIGPDAVGELVRRSGIDEATTVVFYGYAPAMGYWLLRRFGHPDVRILDASRATWHDAGMPWTTAPSAPTRTGYELGADDPGVRASLADVRDAVDHPGSTVLDVRSPLEYDGERFWPSGGMHPDGRAGHVPGALNAPADGYLRDDGSFRSAEELAARFPDVDDTGTGDIITYCTIGARACAAWFVLTELLGRDDVRVYDGSWAEWGLTPSAPVER